MHFDNNWTDESPFITVLLTANGTQILSQTQKLVLMVEDVVTVGMFITT